MVAKGASLEVLFRLLRQTVQDPAYLNVQLRLSVKTVPFRKWCLSVRHALGANLPDRILVVGLGNDGHRRAVRLQVGRLVDGDLFQRQVESVTLLHTIAGCLSLKLAVLASAPEVEDSRSTANIQIKELLNKDLLNTEKILLPSFMLFLMLFDSYMFIFSITLFYIFMYKIFTQLDFKQ